ncbi:hypothetical protein FNV43_RR15205 [Rhamnella rubrinervis]|uniref:Thioesterase domain-containing protein n=1 Tax=Rhamnella rubrinervis TaxID=2594499 RepID=A0A8K0ECH8_9ROSA|nr:hypothetical protein FNV43_RR15205 [Rhamnella rubrinervis]
MAKPSYSSSSLQESSQKILSSTAIISEEVPPEYVPRVLGFLQNVGVSALVPDHCNAKEFCSNLVSGLIKPLNISRGHVTCLLNVKPAVANYFGSLHGGAVGAVAEAISIACARTVVAEDKELFLGELSISYLSGAPMDAAVIVDGHVVRSGRNLTVVTVDFKLKETEKLVYVARATFYNMPVAKL